MEQKIKVIALFGRSGCGKNTLQNYLLKHISNSHKIINCTTRPIRDYEKDKVDYYFLTSKEFAKKIEHGDMIEAAIFNNWGYGTTIEALQEHKINIGVFNIESINCLLEDSRLKIIPIYITVDSKIALLRSLQREEYPDCKEICRRFLSDEKDFQNDNIDFDYLTYDNNNKQITIEKIIPIEWLK